MKKIALLTILVLLGNFINAQEFKIINNNTIKRGLVTDSINSNGFTVGINKFGGGYITMIKIPGIGNIMGPQSQKYGRGGQSSIRDKARGGQYNPTQAGFSDLIGTECKVIKISSDKLVIPNRGCALYNGDGKYDYTEWENIKADPNKKDGGNSDNDKIDESNLSVTINGQVFTKQEAEVHSDFDFYGEYENYTNKIGLKTPAIRHYFEYSFIRSSTLPNAAMKQFNKSGLKAAGKWDKSKFLKDISEAKPEGKYPGDINDLNSLVLSWSIRNDVAIWDPKYRHKQLQNGKWEIEERIKRQHKAVANDYKLRFIIADNYNEDIANALGFYLPKSHINTYNVLGMRESDNTEVYKDNRTSNSYYLDGRRRTPKMSWIGFRSELNGLIDRSKLTGKYEGVYEKIRQEVILVQGTPKQIKTAFKKLDSYYVSLNKKH